MSDPVVNIHNVARSIYTLGDRLYDLNNLHKQALLNFDGDTGYLNASDVQHFSNQFRHAIEPYEAGLLKAKLCNRSSTREIMDIIKDIDHAKDYYGRLAKDHNVLRSEDAPRFRDAESISRACGYGWFKHDRRRQERSTIKNTTLLHHVLERHGKILTYQ